MNLTQNKVPLHLSLASLSVDEAVERLAMRKMALAYGQETPLADAVLRDSDFLQALVKKANPEIMSSLAADPSVQSGLLGAGLGIATGLGASAMSGRKNKRWLSNAATGALAGGALGFGGHMALNPQARQGLLDKISPPPQLPDVGMTESQMADLDQRANSSNPERMALYGGAIGAAGLGVAARHRTMDSTKVLQQLRATAATDPLKAPKIESFLQQLQTSNPPGTSTGRGMVLSDPASREKGIERMLSMADRGGTASREFVRSGVDNLLGGKADVKGSKVPTISNAGRVARSVGDKFKGMSTGGRAATLGGVMATSVGIPLLASLLAARSRGAAQTQQEAVLNKIRNFKPGAQ